MTRLFKEVTVWALVGTLGTIGVLLSPLGLFEPFAPPLFALGSWIAFLVAIASAKRDSSQKAAPAPASDATKLFEAEFYQDKSALEARSRS